VGGLDGGDLLQAGLYDQCVGGQQQHGGFVEEYPGQTGNLSLAISPGDVITASVFEVSGTTWDARVSDESTGDTETASLNGYGGGGSAEWFIEAYGTPTDALANFGAIAFTNLLVNNNPAQIPAAQVWEMLAPDGSVVVQPSDPTSGAYRLTYE
jgi:hypothetical protein